MGTAIYLLTNHISEVQYNNWGNGVWNNLLTIQGTGNCSDSDSENNKDDEYHKACIKKDIETYLNLQDMWNSDYWETWYKQKINADKNTYGNTKDNFLKLGSWEKFREVCTKGIDELIKKQDWKKLSDAVGASSSQDNYPSGKNSGISYEECWKAKSYTSKKK